MDPLKRKCFAGSLAVHGSLLLVIIFGSAFLSSRHETEEVITPFTMVSLTDGPATTPKPAIEAPAPADPISAPPAEPVSKPSRTQAEPEPVHVSEPVVHHSKSPKRAEKKPEPKEEPREEEPSKETAKDSTPETEAGTLPRHPDKKPKTDAKTSHPKGKPHHATEVDLTHKVERRVDASSAAAADRAEADAKAGAEAERAEHQKRAALANSLRTAAHTISAQGSTSTEIAMPGDLGPEFANYNHLIFSKYKLRYDQAVLKAGEFAAENLSVQVSITIARDGKVTEKKLTAPSGNRVLDRLVRQVIDEVKSVAPFPPETHDTERTFEIIFNLKPNRQI